MLIDLPCSITFHYFLIEGRPRPRQPFRLPINFSKFAPNLFHRELPIGLFPSFLTSSHWHHAFGALPMANDAKRAFVIMLRIAADYEELAEWAEKTQYLGGCRL